MGRPKKIPVEDIASCLLAQKDKLIDDKGNVVSKNNPVWWNICAAVQHIYKLKPETLCTYVQVNRYNFRTIINKSHIDDKEYTESTENEVIDETDNSSAPESDIESETESLETKNIERKGDLSFHRENFVITLSIEEWNNISPEEVQYVQKSKNGKHYKRTYFMLKRQLWTHVIHSHLFEHLRCP